MPFSSPPPLTIRALLLVLASVTLLGCEVCGEVTLSQQNLLLPCIDSPIIQRTPTLQAIPLQQQQKLKA